MRCSLFLQLPSTLVQEGLSFPKHWQFYTAFWRMLHQSLARWIQRSSRLMGNYSLVGQKLQQKLLREVTEKVGESVRSPVPCFCLLSPASCGVLYWKILYQVGWHQASFSALKHDQRPSAPLGYSFPLPFHTYALDSKGNGCHRYLQVSGREKAMQRLLKGERFSEKTECTGTMHCWICFSSQPM